MATRTLAGLEELLRSLNVTSGTDELLGSTVLSDPVDIYRLQLSAILGDLVGCDPQTALNAIATANEITNGDLDMVLPRLKLKEKHSNPKELASELMRTVRLPKSIIRDPE
jgi:arginyl-tRNA synthetase